MNRNVAKAAIITGAASGIGLEVAKRFAALDYDVALLDRSKEPLESAVQSIESTRGLHTIAGDLTCTETAIDAMNEALATFPHASVLVHCAGILKTGKLHEIPLESWDENFAIHVRSPIVLTRAFVEGTSNSEARLADPFRVVGVSSIAASRPRAGNGAYSASKAALNVAFKVLAVDIADLGYTVNIVTPGRTNTPMVADGISGSQSSGWRPSLYRLSVA